MHIHLPNNQPYFDKIRSGSVTAIRLPKTEIETGETLTILSSSGDSRPIKLKDLSSETVSLEAITPDEAEQEGFTAPDFCPSQFLCGSIKSRIDFEEYVFKYENDIPVARSEAEREAYLLERVQKICPSCIIRKDAKELFLNYWKPKTAAGEMTRIGFEVID